MTQSVFKVSGPVRIDTVPTWLQAPGPWAGNGVETVDFSAATEIDSAALALMLHWLREAASVGRTVSFVHLPANLKVLAQLYGVEFLLNDSPSQN